MQPELHTFDDLDGWEAEFAAEGLAALERLLDSHARFDAYLEGRDGNAAA